jgi:hypothetical protein
MLKTRIETRERALEDLQNAKHPDYVRLDEDARQARNGNGHGKSENGAAKLQPSSPSSSDSVMNNPTTSPRSGRIPKSLSLSLDSLVGRILHILARISTSLPLMVSLTLLITVGLFAHSSGLWALFFDASDFRVPLIGLMLSAAGAVGALWSLFLMLRRWQ